MPFVMKPQLVIIVLLSAYLSIRFTQCEVILSESQLSAYQHLQCIYDLKTSNRICDCLNQNQAFVLEIINGNINRLVIRNCRELRILKDTFERISHLQDIQIEHIGNLILEKNSIQLPGHSPTNRPRVTFNNVTIDELNSLALGDGLDTIQFINCHINKIKPFAIKTERLYSIAFENTHINEIDSQALKKNQMEEFKMTNTTITNPLPTRTFYDLTVTNTISITACSFATISTSAFMFRDSNQFMFSNNRVEKIEGQAFHINVNEVILFERNHIIAIDNLAFVDIGVGDNFKHTSLHKMWFTFQSNTLQTMAFPFDLRIPNEFRFRLIDLKVMTPITCDDASNLRANQLLKQFSDEVYFYISSNMYSLATILSSRCAQFSTTLISVISISLVIILILIIGLSVLLYRFILKKQQEKRQIPVVMPDGKTYRETQIVMQIEHAGLLKTDL